MVSDIRVTCGEESFDVLQKAFPVGKFMVAGLAGDVETGFALLESLREFLAAMQPAEDECCEPEWVADEWPVTARKVYAQIASDGDRASHLLTVGVSPQQGTLGDARAIVTVYRSPEFAPETLSGGHRAISIGSGSQAEPYRSVLQHLVSDTGGFTYMQAEVGSPGGFGRLVASMLHREAHVHPENTVSPLFHLFIVRLGTIEEYAPQGMPGVARTWPELLEKLQGKTNGTAFFAR